MSTRILVLILTCVSHSSAVADVADHLSCRASSRSRPLGLIVYPHRQPTDVPTPDSFAGPQDPRYVPSSSCSALARRRREREWNVFERSPRVRLPSLRRWTQRSRRPAAPLRERNSLEVSNASQSEAGEDEVSWSSSCLQGREALAERRGGMSEDRARAHPVATRTTLVLSGCGEVDEGEKVGSLVRHLTDSLLCVSLEQLASRSGRPLATRRPPAVSSSPSVKPQDGRCRLEQVP